MKSLYLLYVSFYLMSMQLFALDSRSEMMVRYYEDRPIVEKRTPISLNHAYIEWGEGNWAKLDTQGLKASPDMLILDTFSLKYNENHPYIMLEERKVDTPSEYFLMVRKGLTVYILDLAKEIKIGQFTLAQHSTPSYVSLIKDEHGNTALQMKSNTDKKVFETIIYSNGIYMQK